MAPIFAFGGNRRGVSSAAALQESGASMQKIIRLIATVDAVKDARGRRSGTFVAHYKGLTTEGNHISSDSALEGLGGRLVARCEDPSTYVNVLPIRGHVGVFSSDLQGRFLSQHAWPDGHVSTSSGGKDMTETEDSFRLHVAQITWDGTMPESSDILTGEKLRELRFWASFQLAYRYATNDLGMDETEAHLWACNHSKEFLAAQ
jgi:hypothetical protein